MLEMSALNSLRLLIYVINSVNDSVILSQRRSPTGFLETYPLYYFVNYDEQSEYSWYLDSLTDQISIALSQV